MTTTNTKQELPEEHYYLGNGQEIPNPRTQTNTTQNKELEAKCNCIMSGYAQTTNYCPVHTTQNKEELEQEVRWRQRLQGWLEQVNLLEQKPNVQGGQLVFKGTRVTLTSLINFIIDVRDKSLSQAHQSGIEEERKRASDIVKDAFDNKIVTASNGNIFIAKKLCELIEFGNEKKYYTAEQIIESLKENKQ